MLKLISTQFNNNNSNNTQTRDQAASWDRHSPPEVVQPLDQLSDWQSCNSLSFPVT